jgi:predicted dehydrogenase
MKTAVIGTGLIAHTHVKALRECGEEVTLVVGRTRNAAASFAEEFNISEWAAGLTPENMRSIECVHICTPPSAHYETAELCLKSGIPVVCEKPLALDPREAVRLKKLAALHSEVVSAVVFNNRFYPAVQKIRREAAAADSGKLLFLCGHYFQEYDVLPALYSWRCDAGGPDSRFRAVSEIGSHSIDLLEFMTGQHVEKVCAVFIKPHTERYLRDGVMYAEGRTPEKIIVNNEDAASLMLRLSGGAVATIMLSEISPGRSNDLSVELVYDSVSFSWCSDRPYEICTGRKGAGVCGTQDDFGGGFSTTFTDCFREVHICIAEHRNSSVLATVADAAHVAMVCECIGRSAAAGGTWIDVNEVTCEYES